MFAVAGCALAPLPGAPDTNLEEIAAITGNPNLTDAEKRQRLEDLGVEPVVINTFLKDEITANQFGGTLASALDKVVQGRLSEMTPDEVQLYTEGAAVTPDGTVTSLDDKAAALSVALFRKNGIDTLDELRAFLDDEANEVPNAIPENALRQIFLDVDPNEVRKQLP
jgi:hypothetical protein